jgi:hypothetical protein
MAHHSVGTRSVPDPQNTQRRTATSTYRTSDMSAALLCAVSLIRTKIVTPVTMQGALSSQPTSSPMNIATLVMVGVYMLLLIAVRPFSSLEDMVSAVAQHHVRA